MRFTSKTVAIGILGTSCLGLGLYFVSIGKPKTELKSTLPNFEKSREPSVAKASPEPSAAPTIPEPSADTASPDEPTDYDGSGPMLYTAGVELWAEPGRVTPQKIDFGTHELESSDGTISVEPIQGYVPVSISEERTINQQVWAKIHISPGELYCDGATHEVAKTGWLPRGQITSFPSGC